MKKRTYFLLPALIIMLVLSSCDKDQRCINWLEGNWDVTSLTTTDTAGNSFELIDTFENNGTTTRSSGEFVFEKYNNNKEEEADATLYVNIEITNSGFTITQKDTTEFTYQILEDCETIRLTEKDGSETDEADIIESSKKRMVFTYTDEDQNKIDVTIEKKDD